MQGIDFQHAQSAHCESGVCSNLLNHEGLNVSEAMAFGIGGGLFFGYFPFIRMHGLPLITYRAAAGTIFKRFSRMPGFSLYRKQFRSREQAVVELDEALSRSIPVGLQTGVFWLPYFPKDMTRARFASGALAPKGKMYYFTQVPEQIEYQRLIADGIGFVRKMMLGSPFFLIGIKGIRFLANRLEQWPRKLGKDNADLHLGHVVRMQEEIGTGGGGFRFMYAAFLQESAEKLGAPALKESASLLTYSGDLWRQFAVIAARICKGRARKGDSYEAMAEKLRECAAFEQQVFSGLEQWLKAQPQIDIR